MSNTRTPQPAPAKVRKVSLRLDLNALTIGDLEDFAEATGTDLEEAMRPRKLRDGDGDLVLTEPDDGTEGKPQWVTTHSPTTLRALVWLAQRKTDPTFTYDDARDILVAELDLTQRKTAPPAKRTPTGRTGPGAPRSSATSTT